MVINSDYFFMRLFWVFILVFITSLSFASSLSESIELISKRDYSNAINVLLSLEKTKENQRIIDYYLSECYLLLKDFSNSLVYGERVISDKSDFMYVKSLYNVIFSSYMLNIFDKSSSYGIEYLEKVGDSQGIESLVLTMTVNSLVSMGNFTKAKDVLSSYKDKYPTLYLSLMSSLEKFDKVSRISHDSKVSEDKVSFYLEVLRDILVSLDNISKKRDSDIEKLEEIIYILELKERALKVKKYQLMLGQ